MRELTPPSKLARVDPLDVELYDMARAHERGFVQFPPPPPPVDTTTALAHPAPAPRSNYAAPPPQQEEPVDTMRVVTRILVCIALAIPVWSAWLLWRDIFK